MEGPIVLFPEELVPPGLISRYVEFIFIASCGAIQVGAAVGGLRGLLFIQRRRFAFLVGVALLLSGYVWFFDWHFTVRASYPRGLEGSEQTILFTLAAGGAVFFTVLATMVMDFLARWVKGLPIVQQPSSRARTRRPEGLEALKEEGYLDLLGERIPTNRS